MRPNAPLVRPADMVLAPESARIATPNTTGVGSAVRLDTDAFTAPARGMAATGQGLQSAADQGFNLEMKRLEAIGINQENEVDMAMTEAEGRIAVELAREPDETKWEGIAAKHIEAARNRAGQINMSRATREAVMPKLERWAIHRGDQVATDSAEHSIRKAARAVDDRVKLSIQTGDTQSLEQNLAARRKFGSSNDAQDEMDRLAFAEEAGRKAKEARANEVITIARTQGKEAAEAYAKESGAEPVEVERLLSDVAQIHRDEVGKVGDAFEEAVFSGLLRVPGEVDKWMAGDPRISARMREQFKGYVAAKNDETRKQNILAQAPELSSRYLSEVRQLDPATATDEDFNALRMRIAELPEGYREIPYSRLMSKFRKSDDAPPEVAEVVDNELHSYLEAGLFGAADDPQLMPVPLDAADVYTAEELKKMPIEERVTKRESRKAIEEENKRIQARIDAAARSRKSVIGGKVRRWMDANPKATPEQALQYMRTVLPDSTRAAMFDAFDAPSTVEGNGAEMDLPTRGGPVENTLLPPLLQ